MKSLFKSEAERATAEIERKAAYYLTRLYSGDMTAGEEAALTKWLDADPRHRAEFDAQLAVADAYVDQSHSFHVPELETGSGETRHTGRVSWPIYAAMVATVIVVFLSFMQFSGPVSPHILDTRYETGIGEQRTVQLPDGSLITLNTGTILEVSFTEGERAASLQQGEAYFEIAKSKNRMFTVNAGSQTVTVLGTKFNIQKRGQEYTVAVMEGLVAVHPRGQLLDAPVITAEATHSSELSGQFRLKAGHVLTYKDKTDLVAKAEVADTSIYSQWSSGIVTFDDATLADVVAELGRYTSKKIVIVDHDIETMKVSGVFHLRRLDEVVLGLEQAFPLQVILRDDAILISGS